MYLRNIDIIGFRGINRLSILLRPDMVLIGENAWGKSSLLDALSLILNTRQALYQFTEQDFHRLSHQYDSPNQIMLLFTFSESYLDEKFASYNQRYQELFVSHDDNYQRIYLRVIGEKNATGQITTQYAFLDQNGEPLALADVKKQVKSLMGRFPVYRFRDARLQKRENLNNLVSEDVDKRCDFYQEMQALSTLLQYYFFNNETRDAVVNQLQDTTELWQQVKSLCLVLKHSNNELKQAIFTRLTQLFADANSKVPNQVIQPIVLLEDPDARLHPRMVAIMWELFSYLPIQRITTTNSVELLALVELRSICRLVRYPDMTKCYQLAKYSLSKQALRRLTFHIHHNRSLALFANTWILVEGETEVWLLSALAELLDINLDLEGIRIVEFAQSGLAPLIKYVKAMGIEWHVLTDGDQAGRKYADTVKSMLNETESVSERLTFLPKKDIEHFLYSSGFEQVFIRLARWNIPNYFPVSKIIKLAIKRTSKPDLALALAEEVERQGKQSIPPLFHRLFLKVVNLTKS
ncbi:ATP-dependent endonuclease [Pasteurellaceae bacterium 15-036681]|nr:ATP-dependent endonuclease [Pasteurellaceae bacterium 15-036681]